MNPIAQFPSLVILPGLLCDERMFAPQVAAFARSQVIGGFYAGCNSITAMAEHALNRMPDRAVLLGHSMGARVAIEVARLAAERVAGLVIVDSGVHPVKPGERAARHAIRDIGREQGMAALVDVWLPPMVAPENRRPELMSQLGAMCRSAGLETFERQIGALLRRPDTEAALDQVACPALVAVGAEDMWSPVSQHQAIVERLNGAELRVIPGAGHMLPAEAPAEFNACLAGWLARVGLGPSE
ncbi:MAG: alpha/beta hydrolase [Novosphingobium sp.]